MQLTRHIRLSELTYSKTANARGLDNTPNLEETVRLGQVAFIAQILRDAVFKSAIVFTSGFRSEAVNAAVGGTSTSDHRNGWAGDFYPTGWDLKQAAEAARDYLIETNIPFDQLIYEPSRGVIHISVSPRYRRQILTQAGGPGTPIVEGIV